MSRADARAELGCDSQTFLIGTVSRLGEQRKGIDYFLGMARLLASASPQVRFVVVGGGPLQAELEERAHALDLTSHIVFTGNRRDIPRLLAAMDVFVMPSLYEGGPITVLEAMAMAKPVVSTPVGMVPDVVEDGRNGLLVPTGDSAALARAVSRLLDDPALAAALGEQARVTVERQFSPDAMVDGVVSVYREVA